MEKLDQRTERETGLDLIRCLGLFFVNGVHFFLKNGFYSEPQTGALIWAADCFRWLFFSCNGIFMLLTGYLKSAKPYRKGYYKCLIPILIGYAITCMITYPIRHFLLDETLSAMEWLGNFLSFSNYAWYLEMYVGLILISPVINLVLAQIRIDRELYGFAGLMLLLTALPSITALPIVPDYWKGIYPLTYYVLGAVIRRTQPKVKFWQAFSLLAMVVMLQGSFSVGFTDESFSDGFVQGYGGFWTTLTAVLVFLCLYQIKIPGWLGRAVTWLSAGCMEGYLLSIVLDRSFYELLPQWHSPEKYPLLFLCVTIPIFLISILSGRLVHGLSGKLAKRLGNS